MMDPTTQFWMDLLASGGLFAGAYSDGDPKAATTGTVDGFSDLIFNPEFATLAMMLDPQGGDWNQAFNVGAEGYDSDGNAIEVPREPLRTTPNLDRLGAAAEGTHGALIAQMVQDPSYTQADINEVIRGWGLDENVAGDWVKVAESAQKELDDYSAARAEYDAQMAEYQNRAPSMSPINQQLADAGLPTMDQQYDEKFFDPAAGQRREAIDAQMGNQEEAYDAWKQALTTRRLKDGLQSVATGPEPSSYGQQAEPEQAGGMVESGGGGGLYNLVPTALGGPGFNPSKVVEGGPLEGFDPSQTSQWLYDKLPNAMTGQDDSLASVSGRARRAATESNVTPIPASMAQGGPSQQDIGKLLRERNKQYEVSHGMKSDDLYQRKLAEYRAVSKQMQGRTPTGDAMASRMAIINKLMGR